MIIARELSSEGRREALKVGMVTRAQNYWDAGRGGDHIEMRWFSSTDEGV